MRAPEDSDEQEQEFLRGARAQVDYEVFLARFSNWKLSVIGALAIGGSVGALYYDLTRSSGPLWWMATYCGLFLVMGALCIAYEQQNPAVGSVAQRRWLNVWVVMGALGGASSGSLPLFLPPEPGLQLSAAAIQSIVLIAYVVSRAHRPLIYAMVAAQTLLLLLALALHARIFLAVPVCLLFAVFVLVFGLSMNTSMRIAVGRRLYALHLSEQLRVAHGQQLRAREVESVMSERRRVMEEMSDGFGSTLQSSLLSLESGRLSPDEATLALRECVDDLRLMVDAQAQGARDIPTLLGMLRHRLQRRIEAAGIQLHWNIGTMMQRRALEPSQSLDLLRLLQEAITNALRHAGARNIELSAQQLRTQVELRVQDDGRGFDASGGFARGRGIGSMQSRARRLGATLTIESEVGAGTAVTVLLPPPRSPPAGTK